MLSSPHSTLPRRHARPPRLRVVAVVAAVAALAATLALTQQQQAPTQDTSSTSQPVAIRMPDASAQMEMQQQQRPSKKVKLETANAERRKQIADDAAKLLELATALKTEVDKTDKDTLSLQVIRKAESIEKLAKGVKEKMKLSGQADARTD